MSKIYLNWSGGKDCCMALNELVAAGTPPQMLLTTANEATGRVSMHGVRHALITEQAKCLELPIHTVFLPEKTGMEEYNAKMKEAVSSIKEQGFTHAAFGDIFLEDLRAFRDEKLAAENITTIYPLWKNNTAEQALRFIEAGYKAVVVCVSHSMLDESFCGRLFDERFLADLPLSVDPCGENGEFHTFVYDGPVFTRPVSFIPGERVYRTYPSPVHDGDEAGFWYQELLP
jgi:uncharacterized protein (TIGR00290 family)